MFSRKIKTRFGHGVLRKCRGCKATFGFYTDRFGLSKDFILDEFELRFSTHEVTCLTAGIFKEVFMDKKVGSYEKKNNPVS